MRPRRKGCVDGLPWRKGAGDCGYYFAKNCRKLPRQCPDGQTQPTNSIGLG